MLTKGNAPAAKAVGVTGKLRLMPVALPGFREWNERVVRWAANHG